MKGAPRRGTSSRRCPRDRSPRSTPGRRLPPRRPGKSRICRISSLPYSEENNRQIKHSIPARWLYEARRNTIGEVLLQDRRALCDENHLATVIGLNKCVYNILAFSRARLSGKGCRRTKFQSGETGADARLITYKDAAAEMADDILAAVDCIVCYLRPSLKARPEQEAAARPPPSHPPSSQNTVMTPLEASSGAFPNMISKSPRQAQPPGWKLKPRRANSVI